MPKTTNLDTIYSKKVSSILKQYDIFPIQSHYWPLYEIILPLYGVHLHASQGYARNIN